jgi:hypothetical protein
VAAFVAPFVVVCCRSDGESGTLEFTDLQRVDSGWQEAAA